MFKNRIEKILEPNLLHLVDLVRSFPIVAKFGVDTAENESPLKFGLPAPEPAFILGNQFCCRALLPFLLLTAAGGFWSMLRLWGRLGGRR